MYANRGLAGIDGTVSTAAGVALARGRRTVALLGDLTALHEAGGLLVGPTEPEPDLDLVVVNDDGGAIFASLEHGAVAEAPGMADPVERLFGTPTAWTWPPWPPRTASRTRGSPTASTSSEPSPTRSAAGACSKSAATGPTARASPPPWPRRCAPRSRPRAPSRTAGPAPAPPTAELAAEEAPQ